MSETQHDATHTYPCPSCGDQVNWNATKKAFVCPSCGFTDETGEAVGATPPTAASQLGNQVEEYDLEAFLSANPPSTGGLGADLKQIHCENCGATTDYDPNVVANSCAFCGSPHVVQQEEADNRIRPETLIPFSVDKNRVKVLFADWIKKLWFRPNDLKKFAALGAMKGVYLPFWTYDADTWSQWTAEAGYHYYVERRNSDGTTRRERRTRWEPASGTFSKFYDDELVLASKGVPQKMCKGIEPYNLKQLVPYEPAFLSGWLAEQYAVDLREGWTIGQKQIKEKIRGSCAKQVPGDTHRNLQVSTRFSKMKFKHLLLPVWIAAYSYSGKTYRVLINGQTGKVNGEAPWSWIKITLAIIAGLIVLGVIYFLSQQGTAT